jgi:hypothetical protein
MPAGSPPADAVEAVEAVANAARRACCGSAPPRCPWEQAVGLTSGLLHGRPRDPPGC